MNPQNIQNNIALLRSGSYPSGASDIQDHVLWDTVAFKASSTSKYSMFREPQGVNGKTLADTNLDDAGKLPTGKAFNIQSIGFSLAGIPSNSTSALPLVKSLYDVMRDGVVEIVINGREYDLQIPADVFLPSIAEIAGDASNSATSRVGDFSVNPWYGLQIPIPVGTQVNFEVKWTFDNAKADVATALDALEAAGVRLRTKLRGILSRTK